MLAKSWYVCVLWFVFFWLQKFFDVHSVAANSKSCTISAAHQIKPLSLISTGNSRQSKFKWKRIFGYYYFVWFGSGNGAAAVEQRKLTRTISRPFPKQFGLYHHGGARSIAAAAKRAKNTHRSQLK